MCVRLVVLGYLYVLVFSEPSPCVTPNNEQAQCVPLRLCPLLQAAISGGDASLDKFIEASFCGTAKVCCGTSSNYTQTTNAAAASASASEEAEKKARRDYALQHLLPSKTYCGQQHWDDYFHQANDTEDTAVDEFPWLIAMSNDGWCNAVLISAFYAISTPFCKKRKEIWERNGREYNAIIGQHKLSLNVSCTETPYGDDCTEPKLKVAIEEYIDSPNFGISLLRLAERISFTDYIRPICLPTDPNELPKLNDTVVSSSWDYCTVADKCVEDGKKFDRVKKKWQFNVASKCEAFGVDGVPPEHLMCAVPLSNSTVRQSWGLYKYGRPVMYRQGNSWFLAGIVPALPPTAIQMNPTLVNWILENMRE